MFKEHDTFIFRFKHPRDVTLSGGYFPTFRNALIFIFMQCKNFGWPDPEVEGTTILPNVKKYPNTQCHIYEESKLQDHRFEELKHHKL
jgi:hypothetical protein